MEILKQQAFTFLDSLFINLENDGIEVDQFELDHICYRVETDADFYQKKVDWASFTSQFHEGIIGGRPIAILKLNEAWEYKGRSIHFIELPAPKPNRFYPEGFEHAEFVIDSSLETFLLKYENLEFNRKGMSKTLNADVKRMYEQTSVKFHKLAIDKVIALERQILNN
jgi:predicted metalloenzyme YecM